ncbi:hypothetical protein [Streptomyces acidiscabies]|uniref:DUF4352 domain-containing protein n=1 Tax=Streptomyces acidiscabies TaxID=42234 RepID=A0AAP6EHU5_9ACTN|nr:hypothetical protein [Streptomyces acidiscabies]MBP5934733.1 hypothetical protein [Streptomyces sp. LBUM 1476]MBZ3917535.1 hypothetical protein [Streptomyces acidiscabies]MDX2962780.1 hypothetical protein [Streptomyces acidiscabies]MDX3018913.1 hypothetical protein [Streptomyces acidiscabies]MDX3790415.1 hypothetical protein [Streptomyces acidiscabies]
MYEPNVVGDWQEYEAYSGLRLCVNRLERAEPPRGRDDAADGLTYFRLRVVVENRGEAKYCVHLEDGQIDVRLGPDGESAFVDWRNSQFVEGFDVYPLRRVTAVLHAAGPESALDRIDIQVQLRVDDEWTERRLWTGGLDLCEERVGAAPCAGREDDLSRQVSNYLRDQAEAGDGTS